jgi:hypothetical protein
VPGIGRAVFRRWLAWPKAAAALLFATAMVAACDVGSATQTSTASAARTTPSAHVACHAPISGDETASWVIYVNPVYGYCLRYPATWVPQASPDDQPSFSSENSAGPMGLSTSGIYFYVLTTNASAPGCLNTNVVGAARIDNQQPITLAGTSGTKYILTDNDGFSNVAVNVWNSRCYDFFFATKSAATRDSYSHVINLILATFAFGP